MRFLITGASGQLGMEWVLFLTQKNKDFISCSSSQLDISDPDSIKKRLDEYQPDVLINCAAYTAVDKAESEPEKAALVNHIGAKNLLFLCKQRGIRLVHYSTDYVFPGDEKDQKKYPNGYPENAPCKPINEYGRTKYRGEQELINSGADFLMLRVSWLCGAYGNNFVKTMLRLSKERELITVVDDQFGVPTFCKNVIEDTYQLLQMNESGVFHLGSGGLISWYDFATRIFEQQGLPVKVKPVKSSAFKTAAKRPLFSKLDIRKSEQVLGKPAVFWKDGLEELLNTLNS